MKEAHSSESQTIQANQSMGATVSADSLIKEPWQFWNQKDQCEAFLRINLLDSFKGAVELRRRKTYIQEEINKKRSRRSAAVKRALNASRRDANQLRESAVPLGLDDLWTYLEGEIASGIEPLKGRLDSMLTSQPDHILKQQYHVTEQQRGCTSNVTSDIDTVEGHAGKTHKTKRSHGEDINGSDVDEFEDGEYPSDEDDDQDGTDMDGEDQSYDGIIDNDEDESDSERELPDVEGESKTKRGSKGINDRFFNMDDMEEFADRDFENEADEFNYFESMGEESDGSKAAVDMMYGDFFDDPDGAEKDSETDDEDEALHCSRDLEGLDEDEREMELLLQKVENYDDSDEDEDNRDDAELMDFEQLNNLDKVKPDEKQDNEASPQEADDEISRVEKSLISQKHWSLMGEATGRKRPRNSLLDLDIELPQNSSFIHVDKGEVEAEDEHDDDTMGQEEHQDVPIEIIIQQRIKAEVFDNVERKIPIEDQLEAIERLKQKRNKMDRDTEEIDFNKSKMGLGDVYAKRYQEMFMATDQLDDHKKKLAEDFAKLMYKLDSLCNYSIVPKRVSEAEKNKGVSSITVEAPINVVTASRHSELVDEKMEGNKVTRNAKKRKFTNKLKGLLKSGKATLEDINRIKRKAMERNRQKIEDARSIKATGQTKGQGLQEKKRSNRRVNIAELMSTHS